MLEEKDEKLHSDVGEKETPETIEENLTSEKTSGESEKKKPAKKAVTKTSATKTKKQATSKTEVEVTKEKSTTAKSKKKTSSEAEDESPMEKAGEPVAAAGKEKTEKEDGSGKEEDVLDEIDDTNAEDAEDDDNHRRHHIPMQDYHAMSMENLVGELQRLIRTEKVQAIKNHVDAIKSEFDMKFQDFIEEKKEEFVSHGGNEADFKYNSVAKRQFNEVYSDYREKRNAYYRNLEQTLKTNLEKRLQIIEELKSLVNVEEDINTTYKNFKDLQEQWRNAGAVPRSNYNDVWRTYHHHVEIFYDFLHLNRELRDLDFKYNLEEKEKLVQRAEALADEPDLNKAFRELQTLHKIWKEDIGPVDKEHRDAIWERFSNATKAMHQRRQEHFKELEKEFEVNLLKKNEIIASIASLGEHVASDHKSLQKQIREMEALRTAFFSAGKVPQKDNEATWSRFKEAVRAFNRKKNEYYKNLKKEQQVNLDKKRELVKVAESLKDSDDWETVTSQMKKIQQDWKKIGHVPRKYSDKLWKEFKTACNHYFDRMHASKNKASGEEAENLEKKKACLDKLQAFSPGKSREEDLTSIKALIAEWRVIGRVPFNKKSINGKFNTVVDGVLKKLGIDPKEAELMKYGNKLKELASTYDDYALRKERTFIKRKIDEGKSEINQLENNLQFFSNASEDNPLVREVVEKINRQKESLKTWKAKLKKINILQHSLSKEEEEEASLEGEAEEGKEEA
ncbi:protein of unknown function [Muriicola jejuensis]|uniref:DUF349 domain-containing protein n=1 Tax=Muriicola jejuensis TaxID=504488 RepID=A0A6P0UKP2_9FLAO|nr:DUF349 domain-containing protein [Muriicola jejuensis]NER10796.1 DUF349 domain-containing protein [Muriicola jejuensis]SMP16242.1 protein of unknown function [Muriicola jejuensis]